MSRLRTFVAIEPSQSVLDAGAQLIREFSQSVDSVRWVRPENIHLTLKFLGEVEDRELHAVCKITAQSAEQFSAFSLQAQAVGAFPSLEKPSTVWIGVEQDQRLLDLQKHLESGLAELGFPVERRPFRGHLTLGRARSRKSPELRELIEAHQSQEFGLLEVKELVVFASELGRQGPTYTVLGRCPLA